MRSKVLPIGADGKVLPIGADEKSARSRWFFPLGDMHSILGVGFPAVVCSTGGKQHNNPMEAYSSGWMAVPDVEYEFDLSNPVPYLFMVDPLDWEAIEAPMAPPSLSSSGAVQPIRAVPTTTDPEPFLTVIARQGFGSVKAADLKKLAAYLKVEDMPPQPKLVPLLCCLVHHILHLAYRSEAMIAILAKRKISQEMLPEDVALPISLV